MKCAKVLMVFLAVSLCCGVVYAGDDCANRTTAVCDGAGGAADPANDTTPTGPVGSCATGNTGGNGAPGVNDTFVEFVATATSARIRTDLNSVGTDSDYGVYSVDQGDVCNKAAWVEIGCSEDESGFLGDISVAGLTIGDTYIVQVGHWNDAYSGAFVVDVQCPTDGAICGDGIISLDGTEVCDPGNGTGEPKKIPPEQGPCLTTCEPDCTCTPVPTPMLPKWGLMGLALMLVVGGAGIFGRSRMGLQQA